MGTNIKAMKQFDTLPVLEVRCRYKDPLEDLSASVGLGTPVVFIMRNRRTPTATPVIDRAPASVVSSTASVVTLRYEWNPGDCDVIGEYWGEFELDIGGEPLTAPTQGYILVRVGDDLG
jgi:hypothetical protein